MPIPKVKLRAPFGYDTNEASKEAELICRDPSLTQQHHAADTDVNLIVKRYMNTGILPQGALAPLYGDFRESLSFHDAQNKIREAQEAFMLIPAEIRAKFDNDPGKFVEFASEEANRDELVKLKLLDPPPRSNAARQPTEKAAPGSGESADPTPQGV